MPSTLDEIKSQNTQLTAKLKAEEESELEMVVHLSKDADKLAGSAIAIAQTQHVQNLESASTGLHVVGVILSALLFLRAMNDFLKGEKVSWPDLGRMAYFGAALTLIAIGALVPALAAIMTLVAASIGIVYSAYHLLTHLLALATNPRELKHLQGELDTLQEMAKADHLKLKTLSEKIPTAEREEQLAIKQSLQDIRARIQTRDKQCKVLLNNMTRVLTEKETLKQQPVITRCLSVLGASIALAGAITFFFNPFVAGILFAGAFTIGCGLGLYAIGSYLKEKWFSKDAADVKQDPSQMTPQEQETEGDSEQVKVALSEHKQARFKEELKIIEKTPRRQSQAPVDEERVPQIFKSPSPSSGDEEKKEDSEGDSNVPH